MKGSRPWWGICLLLGMMIEGGGELSGSQDVIL